jgi:uncharacterized protein
MIAALARGGALMGEAAWVQAAGEAAAFFLDKLWDAPQQRLWRRYAGGERKVEGQLDDYAFLAWGCFELYQADPQPRWLQASLDLVQAAYVRFVDEADGLYFLAGREGDPLLPARVKESHDNVEPSAVSVLVDLQLRLAALGGDASLRVAAERTLKALQAEMQKNPRGQAFMITALDRALSAPVHLVLTGEGQPLAELLRARHSLFLPHLDAIVALPDGSLPLPGAVGSYPAQGAAYACQGLACQPPVQGPQALLQALQTL